MIKESIFISIVSFIFIVFQGCAYIEGVFKEPSSPPASKRKDKGVEQAVIRNSGPGVELLIPDDNKLKREWEEAKVFTSKGDLEAALSKYLRIKKNYPNTPQATEAKLWIKVLQTAVSLEWENKHLEDENKRLKSNFRRLEKALEELKTLEEKVTK